MQTMGNSLADIIRRIKADAEAKASKRFMAADEEVAAKAEEMARQGFIPDQCWIEPIRAFLSGYGVMLSGDTGVGKTFFFRTLCRRVRPVSEIIDYGIKDIRNWYSWTDGIDVVIDDLGAESVVAEYGAKEDLLKLVLAHRCERQNGRTHITTNLTAAQISERYGDRTLSRIMGMCRPFRIEGESRRAASPSLVK